LLRAFDLLPRGWLGDWLAGWLAGWRLTTTTTTDGRRNLRDWRRVDEFPEASPEWTRTLTGLAATKSQPPTAQEPSAAGLPQAQPALLLLDVSVSVPDLHVALARDHVLGLGSLCQLSLQLSLQR
jgi:hypothetical protein